MDTDLSLEYQVERYSLAVRSAKIGIWDWDIKNNVLTWDEQMYKLYGIVNTDFGGAYEAWKKGLHPDDVKKGDEEIQLAIKGTKDFDTSFRVLWPDATVHSIRAHGKVIRDAEGMAERMIGVNWDITEKVEDTKLLAARLTELEELYSEMIDREQRMVTLKEKLTQVEKLVD